VNGVRSVLVLSAGSSSLKFAIHQAHASKPVISGQIGGTAYSIADGVGENAPPVRAGILDRLQWLGVDYDAERNRRNEPALSPATARCPVYIVPANEELAIARHAYALIR
jgi:acetate kinase